MRRAYLFAFMRKFVSFSPPLPVHSHAHNPSSSSVSSLLPSSRLRRRSPGSLPSSSSSLARLLPPGFFSLAAVLQRAPILTHIYILLLIIFGPYYAPATLAVLFLLTHTAFMLCQFRSAYGMIRCWWGTRQHARTDWVAYYRTQCLALETQLSLPPTPVSPFPPPSPTDRILPLLSIEHIVIVPNYKEDLSTLRETLDVLASHPLAGRMYKVCLAMEEREAGSAEKGAVLADEYGRAFLDVTYCLHPAGIPGESAGKSSNVAWAARFMAAREMDNPARLSRQVITVMDSDTCFAADFFLSVAVKFALAPPDMRDRMMFAPPILFDRNQDDVPVFTRVTDIFWASAGIGGLYPSSMVKIPTSAYAMSMSLAVYVGFWDAGPEAIGEDLHMYTKAMFDTCGHLYVETIYSPASQCNVVGAPAKGVTRLVNDASARWTQAIRHMWGSLDTGYAWHRLLTQDFGPSKDRGNLHLLTLDSRAASPGPFVSVSSAATVVAASEHGGSEPPSSPSIPETTSDSERDSDESEFQFPLTGTVSPATTLVGDGGADEFVMSAASSLLNAPSPLLKHNTQLVPLSPPSGWKTAPAKIFPLVVLVSRLYEAHLMIAHFFLMVTLMNLYPAAVYSNGSFSLLDLSRAPALTWALFRTPYAAGAPQLAGGAAEAWGWLAYAPSPVGATLAWVMPDLVSATLRICKLLGAMGVAFSVVMAVMHDVYFREATLRWKNSERAAAAFRPVQREEEDTDEFEKLAGDSDPLSAFPARYLGIRPRQTATRTLPYCLVDYLAIPSGLLFGVAPLLVAQARHLWTNRLMYTVSAKPVGMPKVEGVQVGVGMVYRDGEEEGKLEMDVLGVGVAMRPQQAIGVEA